MASTPSTSSVGTTLLLFGPQALSFSAEALQTLRKVIRETDDCNWMLEIVSELPTRWHQLVQLFPKLECIPGEQVLNDLKDWFQGEDKDKATAHLPNVLLTPLVVLAQLTQFSRYLSYTSGASAQADDPWQALARRHVETVGLCTGLLSASAISSASDAATFRQYGAVAAYISVLFDDNRATVTTADGTAALVLQQLRQRGLKAVEMSLRGRFHSQVHHGDLERMLGFCDSDPAFQFPDVSALSLPIHLGKKGAGTKLLHHAALRMILVEQATWYETFSGALPARLESAGNDPAIIAFGLDSGVPPSLLRKIGPRLVLASDLDQVAASRSARDDKLDLAARDWEKDSDIAVVGMSCKVAGADDLNEFWKILCAGESQHVEVPEERFGPETHWRDVDPTRKWYGNFIRDHDVFDHKFFKKSPREMASADPQQRLMLQCAYQAVEQSGYFHQTHVDTKIGCYLTRPAITLQCKPWDEGADGYCRGEAVALVFLKRMRDAMADGNPILGCISSTAVYQNENCTPVFVPNSPSLTYLFKDVLERAKLEPKNISVVEAHGTGTPVGDPAEYQSVLQALGGKLRDKPLALGSVKGLIGHTEGASGVVSLIKIILMLQHGYIPPQASFRTLAHNIAASPSDNIEIVTKLKPWDAEYKAALINNYGASGSNASMVVTQPPRPGRAFPIHAPGIKHPFWLCGLDDRALVAYSTKLRQFIADQTSTPSAAKVNVANLAFNVCRQSNRQLERGLMFTCSSLSELDEKLCAFVSGDAKVASVSTKTSPRPVILCFGGQVSNFVGLDRKVYDSVRILRSYLDQCNAVFLSMGLEGIFPAIFQREPIEDTVRLQTALFALQYACARSWMDCGIRVEAVVGHSFGELTALCISGVLSLQDTARMIAARAKLVRDAWGAERGAMMAIEADLDVVQSIIESHNRDLVDDVPINIACYNGPRSFTLAGSTTSMDKLTEALTGNPVYSTATRFKRLSVTNAFHSALVEPLMDELDAIGRTLTFREPSILIERATEELCMETTSEFVAQHMREPVFFRHAVERLARQYPDAAWIEAGSASTITNMASRALGSPSACHFQSLNITCDQGMQSLADTTLALWKAGVKTQHWPHHASQTSEFDHLFLPPYQFEKVKHWMDLKKPLKGLALAQASETAEPEIPVGLWSFLGYQDAKERTARFLVNTNSKKYQDFVSGHLIANTAPICPATLEVDMAIEALMSIRPEIKAAGLQPTIQNMQNHAPICVDPSRQVFIEYEASNVHGHAWHWKITSSPAQGPGVTIEHVHGNIVFRSPEDPGFQAEFDRFGRHFTHRRCLDVLNSVEADDIIQGRNIYKTFAEIVDYGEEYRGLKRLVGRGNDSAGRVSKRWTGETWLDTHLADCFSQVGGIWVNCMTNRAPEDMYIASGCDLVMRSPKLRADSPRPDVWDVFATHHQVSEKLYVTDIFTFDSTNGELLDVMIGINYARVPKASMQKILARLSPGISTPSATVSSTTAPKASQEHDDRTKLGTTAPGASTTSSSKAGTEKAAKKSSGPTKADIKKEVRNLLANVAGVEPADISEDTMLADIGIDSLMGMELAREAEAVMNCTLSPDKLMEAFDFPSFVDCVISALGITVDGQEEEVEEEDEGDGQNDEGYGSEPESRDERLPPEVSSGNSSGTSTPPSSVGDGLDELTLPAGAVLECFSKTKRLTDQMIHDYKLDTFANVIAPKSTQLCIALTLEAFEKLGVSIRAAKPGQVVPRIKYAPQHQRLVNYLYRLLENEARLIDTTDDGNHVRTAVSPPKKSSAALLQNLVRQYPDWSNAQKLTQFAGSKLADVLEAKTDGIKIIFGTDEGRALVAGLYCDHVFNKMNYQQMADFVEDLVSKLPPGQGPLRILEMGAGTGGTTLYLAPLLERLQVPVEYLFTDISPSMVGAAKKKFAKYPFMKFMTHDMEKPVPAELLGTQHIVVASNAVHATRDLVKTGINIRNALRPDGFLMMLEMTEIVPFVDTIFGLLEGWWLFEDGRQHAIIGPEGWEKAMHAAGFGHVDWTDGYLPESKIQKVIVAMASGPAQERLPLPAPSTPKVAETGPDLASREKDILAYVKKFSAGFEVPSAPSATSEAVDDGNLHCVLITGATGSLGTHLVKEFAERGDVGAVICLNRQGPSAAVYPETRQLEAMISRGVTITDEARAKLRFIETDSSKPRLGLREEEYAALTRQVTGIVHNAWPMSGNRPIKGFEPAFHSLRNLVNLARDAAGHRAERQQKVNFQLISSIGVVGHYPLWSGQTRVPEERMEPRSVLPNGYCDAKYTCERILDETLHRYPEYFHTMTARLGQVAGSKTSGYWNPVEHFCFMVKSSKSLKVLPRLEGNLTWCPVNDMAAALSELLLQPTRPQPIYHIDNPVQQPWSEMVQMLAKALDIPQSNIVPFDDWVARVRRSPLAPETDNPAARLIDFLEFHFRRMSCGGLLLDLSKACKDSPTLAAVGPVGEDVVRKYVASWKAMGFLP
ncbi:polyketide synthase [Thermothielavioides terrestris NRRL 8126]|uniref:Polyketide synthase n=1 Tax=Thermothielavioides terrestris (strain ATCC 38088 / NRRL 8126) TaxID=578455 RepID=G2QX38_THETT|nr:polyketide synthase [Thermothielavioides terrestris NRRL 8126]AEO64805.1 polyketide synthase [Thermothielavioides terrestris NRRL 8126]